MSGLNRTSGPVPIRKREEPDPGKFQKKELSGPIWNIYRNPVHKSGGIPQFFHSVHQAFSVQNRVLHSFNTFYYDNDFDTI